MNKMKEEKSLYVILHEKNVNSSKEENKCKIHTKCETQMQKQNK